mgnify:CR=1 FL=1
MSNGQIGFSNMAPDTFDVLNAVYDLTLEAWSVDIGVKQSHIELLQFEGELVHIRAQLLAVNVVEGRWISDSRKAIRIRAASR